MTRPPVCLPPPASQAVELKASKVVMMGACDAATYPMAKKKQSFEFLREKAHLRPRTNTIGAVARIRNALATATHNFFQQSGFLYVHTPIITASDCEGAGEMFQVGAGQLGLTAGQLGSGCWAAQSGRRAAQSGRRAAQSGRQVAQSGRRAAQSGCRVPF